MFVYLTAEAPDDGTVIAHDLRAWEALLAAKSSADIDAVLAKYPGKAVPAASFRPVAQIGEGEGEVQKPRPRRCGDLAEDIYQRERDRASAPRKRPGERKPTRGDTQVSVWPYRKAGA